MCLKSFSGNKGKLFDGKGIKLKEKYKAKIKMTDENKNEIDKPSEQTL
jgi:hypothetical protein